MYKPDATKIEPDKYHAKHNLNPKVKNKCALNIFEKAIQ